MQEHPHYSELLALVRGAKGEFMHTWQGPVYRCVALKWARPEYLINGEGTLRFGSRWMRPGVTPAVYAASTEAIALKESRRPLKHFGIRKPLSAPRVVVEMMADLKSVADLSGIEAILPWPGLDELLAEDWERINLGGAETLSQAFGRALWKLGFSGLIVPSARDRRGRNLIWFPENLSIDDEVRISGETELDDWIAK
jgi:RES domain-containing protein